MFLNLFWKGIQPSIFKISFSFVSFRFMSDGEAWQELCDLYLKEGDYSKAAFCMEELILTNPHNHLFYTRYAEIKYTQARMQFWVPLS